MQKKIGWRGHAPSSPARGSHWQGREVYCLQVSFFMPLICKQRTCPLCLGLALRESCRRRRLRGFAAGASRLKENLKTSRPCQTRAQHSQSEQGQNRKKRLFQRHTARFWPGDLLFGVTRGEQPLVRCGERGVQRVRGGSRNTPTRGEQPLVRCGERGVQRVRGGSRNTPLTLWPSGASCL